MKHLNGFWQSAEAVEERNMKRGSVRIYPPESYSEEHHGRLKTERRDSLYSFKPERRSGEQNVEVKVHFQNSNEIRQFLSIPAMSSIAKIPRGFSNPQGLNSALN